MLMGGAWRVTAHATDPRRRPWSPRWPSSPRSSSGRSSSVLTDFENLSALGDGPGRCDPRRARRRRSTPTARCSPGRSATRTDRRRDPEVGTHATIAAAIRPITETLVAATPLIFTGLAVRDLVPDRRVQHRRRGPVHPRRVRRDDRGHPATSRMSPLILLALDHRGRADRRGCGASSPASSRRGRAPTRSSRPSCSTTSRRRSSCSGCAPTSARQGAAPSRSPRS